MSDIGSAHISSDDVLDEDMSRDNTSMSSSSSPSSRHPALGSYKPIGAMAAVTPRDYVLFAHG